MGSSSLFEEPIDPVDPVDPIDPVVVLAENIPCATSFDCESDGNPLNSVCCIIDTPIGTEPEEFNPINISCEDSPGGRISSL